MSENQNHLDAVELAAELTIAWLANPNTRAQTNEVPDFLRTMHAAVAELTSNTGTAPELEGGQETIVPAVTVRKSLASRDHIISLIDGKPYKTLKRHLANNGMTPSQYRERYGLKSDYPMVAPAYAERRRDLAKAIGLGRKRGDTSDGPSRRAKTRKAAAPAA